MRLVCLILACVFTLSSCAGTRKWTKADKALGAYYLAGHAADGITTERMLDNPNNHERNPILGERPSDGEVLGYFVVTSVLVLTLAHLFPKLRKFLLGAGGTVGMALAVNNEQLPRE